LSEVLQFPIYTQQKLLFEVIIPHSSPVWHKTRPAALNKRYLLCKSIFVLSGKSNSLQSKNVTWKTN